MASADILRAARARISDPKKWTTGFFAKSAEGSFVAAQSNRAVCWCALGALLAEAKDSDQRYTGQFLFRASQDLFEEEDPTMVNDALGHAAVLQMYDAAIAAAEEEAR